MAYPRLFSPTTILAFLLVGLLVVAVSCGGAAEEEAESPTAAATQPPVATTAPAATTAPTAPAATPVAQAQPTDTPAPAMTGGQPEGILNVGYKELGLFGTSPKLTPGQVMLFIGSTVGGTTPVS